NKIYYFKDGHERLYWRYKTQFYEEKELCDWIDTFEKKDIFCDIGSNVGMFSVYAAKKKILTYSIEPHPSNIDFLYWNAYLNNVTRNIIVMPLALSKNSILTNFIVRDMTPGVARNYLKEKVKKTKLIKFKFLGISFDEIIKIYKLKYPTKIKLDVDGNELDILKGMNKSLNQINELYIEMIQDKKKVNNYNQIMNLLKKKKFIVYKKGKENFIFKKKNQ
ncbi:FkbM family methyltransferase, partial [Candidatus Pelagibacter sp.]|nr:FkbM family methyltransferase [Candidatus Pelagibacter sp.]